MLYFHFKSNLKISLWTSWSRISAAHWSDNFLSIFERGTTSQIVQQVCMKVWLVTNRTWLVTFSAMKLPQYYTKRIIRLHWSHYCYVAGLLKHTLQCLHGAWHASLYTRLGTCKRGCIVACVTWVIQPSQYNRDQLIHSYDAILNNDQILNMGAL